MGWAILILSLPRECARWDDGFPCPIASCWLSHCVGDPDGGGSGGNGHFPTALWHCSISFPPCNWSPILLPSQLLLPPSLIASHWLVHHMGKPVESSRVGSGGGHGAAMAVCPLLRAPVAGSHSSAAPDCSNGSWGAQAKVMGGHVPCLPGLALQRPPASAAAGGGEEAGAKRGWAGEQRQGWLGLPRPAQKGDLGSTVCRGERELSLLPAQAGSEYGQ